jgi:hypothetical protein
MDVTARESGEGDLVEQLRSEGNLALACALGQYREQLERMIEVRMDPRAGGSTPPTYCKRSTWKHPSGWIRMSRHPRSRF